MIAAQHLFTATEAAPAAWEFITPGLDVCAIEAVVCIPTFRRPDMLRTTLNSLIDQKTQVNFAIVLIDNDSALSAAIPVAEQYFATKLDGLAAIEHKQGNCHAINRAFTLARETFPNAAYFLMIDDDEIASPHWLDTMVLTAKTSGADIVGGPVNPTFGEDAPKITRNHPVFWPGYSQTGPIPLVYGSGNCLITRHTFKTLQSPDFDIRFNFLGGGDTEFFTRCKNAGLKSYWVQDAEITETVPAARANPTWILKRGLRIGAVNFELDRRYMTPQWAGAAPHLKNMALIPVSMLRAAQILAKRRNWLEAMHPIMVALGRILGSFKLETQQYRAQPKTNSHP